MKKILGIIVVAAVLAFGAVVVSKSDDVADPGGGGLKRLKSVEVSYDPGGGGL